MLTKITEDVLVRRSDFCQSNTVVVRGSSGVLLIDPGVHGYELESLADELAEHGDIVVAGFSTHPHWDHLLWHPRLGAAIRYGTALCSSTAQARLADAQEKATRIADGLSLDLLGALTPLPDGSATIPWDGPKVKILEHQGHAPGHAALLIEDHGVLVAGDMLSDVEIPLLDLNDRPDPIQDYLDALHLFDDLASEADLVIPGHGAIGQGNDVATRIDQDRTYLLALREGRDPTINVSARRRRTEETGCPANTPDRPDTSPRGTDRRACTPNPS